MVNKNKQAFTLVELIVVIAILAILWTIAFISLYWYTKSARDSARIADLWSIMKNLELYKIKEWNFPDTTNWEAVTYTWKTVWTQWTFWTSTIAEIWNIGTIPTDPLTGSEYTYSLLNTKKEYQIWAILETNPFSYNKSFLKKANASWTWVNAHVVWNYNGRVASV